MCHLFRIKLLKLIPQNFAVSQNENNDKNFDVATIFSSETIQLYNEKKLRKMMNCKSL